MRARVGEGPDVLGELGERFDDLVSAVGAPVTARRPWLERWIRSYPGYRAVVVAVESAEGLAAVAPLAVRRRAGMTEVVGMGHGTSDYARFPARDAAAAASLGDAVADWLGRVGGPWRLRVEQLPPDDPAARAVAARLPRHAIVPGDGAPRMVFGEDRSVAAVLRKNARQSERTNWNRIEREGVAASLSVLTTPEEIEARFPEMEEIRRVRDVDLGRQTDLVDPEFRSFWRGIVLDHSERGEAEITLLELDGSLAAYVTCFLDGEALRMWDGRFDPRWSRFGAGRIVDLTAFHRAREDEGISEFDWMRGEEDYKFRHGNDMVRTEHLLAWSSALVRSMTSAPGRTRAALRRIKERSPALGKAWAAVKRNTVGRRRAR